MRHTIAVWVENEFGVLPRVAGLFSGRGFNIESLCVAETEDPTLSRITLVSRGNDQIIEQIIKQLRRLIPVYKVVDLTDEPHVDRELVLVKVNATGGDRPEVLRMCEIFRGKVVDASPDAFVIEITGDEGKVNAFLELLKPMGIKEIARSGKVAMGRSMQIDPESLRQGEL